MSSVGLWSFDVHCWHTGTATVPDRVKTSFVIFDIRALWRLGLSARVPGLTRSGTGCFIAVPMSTVDVKRVRQLQLVTYSSCLQCRQSAVSDGWLKSLASQRFTHQTSIFYVCCQAWLIGVTIELQYSSSVVSHLTHSHHKDLMINWLRISQSFRCITCDKLNICKDTRIYSFYTLWTN